MTILGVVEIIPCTAKATQSISEVPERMQSKTNET